MNMITELKKEKWVLKDLLFQVFFFLCYSIYSINMLFISFWHS